MTIRDIAIKIGYDIDSKSYNDAVKSMNKLANTAKRILGVVAVGAIVNRLKSQVEQYTKINNQLAYATDYLADMNALQEKIQKAAANSNVSYTAIASAVKNMVQDTNTWQLSLDDSVQIAERLSRAFRGAGLSREEAGSLIESFSRNFANGRLTNLSEMIEQAPELVNYLAKSLNMTTQGVRALAMRNAITLKQFTKAIEESAEDIDARYSKASLTITDALAYVKEKFFVWLSTDGVKVVNSIAQSIKKFGDNLGPILTKVGEVIERLGGLPAILTRIAAITATIKIFEKGLLFFQKLESLKGTFSRLGSLLGGAKAAESGASSGLPVVASGASKGIGAIAKALGKISWIVAAVYTAIKTDIEIAKFAAGKESEADKALERYGFDVEQTRTETQNVLNEIKDALLNIWNGLGGVFSEIGKIFTGVLQNAIVNTIQFIQTIAPLIVSASIVLQDIFKIVSTVLSAIGKAVERIHTVITTITFLLKQVLEPIGRAIQIITTVMQALGKWLGTQLKSNEPESKWGELKTLKAPSLFGTETTVGRSFKPSERTQALIDAGLISDEQLAQLTTTGTFEGAENLEYLLDEMTQLPSVPLAKSGNTITIIMDNNYTFNGADRSAQTKAADAMDAAGEQVVNKMRNALAYGG